MFSRAAAFVHLGELPVAEGLGLSIGCVAHDPGRPGEIGGLERVVDLLPGVERREPGRCASECQPSRTRA